MYVFYDLEATDNDPAFGQILQIGIVITDDNFNITETRSLRARREPWIVPAPEALLVTGITHQELEDAALPTLFEAMQEFDRIIRNAGTETPRAGYNIMKFDEPSLAAAALQNLLDPPSDTVPRIDVIKMVHACLMHRPGVLNLDEKSLKGHVRTALGIVARQNGVDLSEEDAHEAVGDVKATIGLAKIIHDRAPDIWNQIVALSTPQGVRDFIDTHDMFCISDIFYGDARSRMLTTLGDGIAFDLAADPARYMSKTPAQLAGLIAREKWRGNPFVKFEPDKGPLLMPDAPPGAVKVSRPVLEARAALIKSHPEFKDKIAQALAILRSKNHTPDEIELQQGEPIPAEAAPLLSAWKTEFRTGDWPARKALIDEFPARFATALQTAPTLNRFVQFARRILFDNAPDLMTAAEREQYRAAIYERVMNPAPPAGLMTFPVARAKIESLRKDLAEGTSKILKPGDEHRLDELAQYYDELEKIFTPPAPPSVQQIPPPPAPGP